MPENPNDPKALQEAIDWMRAGEEGGYVDHSVPTPGQFYQRLHELDPEARLRRISALFGAAEVGRSCVVSLHEENLAELRQRAMDSWNVLAALGRMCSDPERDGLVHVSEIVELLPLALRRG